LGYELSKEEIAVNQPSRNDLIGRKCTMMDGKADAVCLMNAAGEEITVPNTLLKELRLDFDEHLIVRSDPHSSALGACHVREECAAVKVS
jgi:hypothetical protein